MRRKLSPVVIRALLTWYSDQKVSVLWNGYQSSKFGVTNGVHQGGVLSPTLFTVYVKVTGGNWCWLLLEPLLHGNGVLCR